MPFYTQILTRLKMNDVELTSLVVKEAQLTDEDIKILCDALKNNSNLKELDLSNNKIGNEGARLLAEYLETNEKLHTVNLNNNQIGNKGAEAFVKCLQVNKYVRTLTLENNSIWFGKSITPETQATIKKLVDRSSSPRLLKILLHPLTHCAGATMLMRRFTDDRFGPDEATIGMDFSTTTIKLSDGTPVKLQISDCNGLECYDHIIFSHMRGVMAYVSCIESESIMCDQFFIGNDLQRLKRRIEKYTLVGAGGPVFLVITRYDLISDAQKKQFEKNIARLKEEFPDYYVMVTSAKTAAGVGDAFQEIAEKICGPYKKSVSSVITAQPTSTAAIPMPISEIKPILATQPQSQITTSVLTSPRIENTLLTNPALQQHLAFLKALPQENLNTLTVLGQQGINLNHLLQTLTDFKTTQANLTQRLQAVEIHTGLDAQTQAEIAYIQKNESLNCYYQVLKMLLGQTFLAAKVIASGDVDASQGTTATVVNGISTVAGAICPPAAPFLIFAATVVAIADGIDSYRGAQTLSDWIDLQFIAQLAETIARQLTIAQVANLTKGLNHQAQSTIADIQNKCTLIVERIKSGQTLNVEESRALLDANALLSYMKANNKPRNADLTKCVAILLPVIMGAGYVHIHTLTIRQQTSVTMTNTTTVNPAITTTIQNHTITREAWEAMQKEIAEAKRKAEDAAKNAASAHKELEMLRKKSAQSNPNSLHSQDNGDGTVSLQQQDQMINTTYGPMPLSTFLKIMQSQIAALEGGLGTTNQVVASLQELQNRGVNNNNTSTEQLRQDLFQGGGTIYQQLKKQ